MRNGNPFEINTQRGKEVIERTREEEVLDV
jgi:hypothetical protein